MSKTKKIIVSVALVLLLAATAYVNIKLAGSNNDDNDATVGFFAEYRGDRTATRDQEILYLDSIISNPDLSEEQVATAIEQKLALVAAMEDELTIESLIKAKGFTDVAVTLSSNSGNVNVIVNTKELTQEEVAKIYDVVVRETQCSYSNVTVIPVE